MWLDSNSFEKRGRQSGLADPGSPESNTTCPSPVFALD
jgi:hypothetical protein